MTQQLPEQLQFLQQQITVLGRLTAQLQQMLQSEIRQNNLMRRMLYGRTYLEPLPETKPAYYLSVACIAKNEGSYLREWLEYHRLVGVEHFYFYDNESTDETRDILDSYIRGGGGRLSLCYRAAHADAGLS